MAQQQTLYSWAEYLFNNADVELLITSTLMLLFTLALVWIRRTILFERRRRKETERQLLNALQRITQLEDMVVASGASSTPIAENVPRHHEYEVGREVGHDELKARLQTPVPGGNAPDKYRHVASMAQQGMSVAQISEVLNLSEVEVNQLVALARIAVHND